eukprot:comp5245_c0_seq1/m.1285 comp5245_c0_seq1/g.1285  ORF comp5245_c0_seq1/g.1285 comp5245_c0_seq1/m.1285 type:complete len:212 (-) comp5245_c0_seq1:404-1039(-)
MGIALDYHDSLLYDDDVRLLEDGLWLNDKIISFFYEYLEYDVFPDNSDLLFVSPITSHLIAHSGAAEAAFVVESLDFGSRQLIFVAVNNNENAGAAGGSHWSLLVYVRAKNRLLLFDSMGGYNDRAAKRMAKQLAALVGASSPPTVEARPSPQQHNGYDCGMYVLVMTTCLASSYVEGKSLEGACDDISPGDVTAKRREIKDLIKTLNAKQ